MVGDNTKQRSPLLPDRMQQADFFVCDKRARNAGVIELLSAAHTCSFGPAVHKPPEGAAESYPAVKMTTGCQKSKKATPERSEGLSEAH